MGANGDTTSSDISPAGATKPHGSKPALLVISGDSAQGRVTIIQQRVVIGRSPTVGLFIDDVGASRNHAEVRRFGEDILLRDLGSKNGTFLNGNRISEALLKEGDKIQVGTTVIKFMYLDAEEERVQKSLYEAATRDSHTGLHNRRYFREVLAKDFARSRRQHLHLSLLMVDVDHFKRVNDTYGHPTGDQVLREVALALNEAVRTEDLTARYGGEEFAVLLKDCDPESAMLTAERLRATVAARKINVGGKLLQVTCSVGVATVPESDCADEVEFLKYADQRLYEAKETGRNRVVGAPPAPPKAPERAGRAERRPGRKP